MSIDVWIQSGRLDQTVSALLCDQSLQSSPLLSFAFLSFPSSNPFLSSSLHVFSILYSFLFYSSPLLSIFLYSLFFITCPASPLISSPLLSSPLYSFPLETILLPVIYSFHFTIYIFSLIILPLLYNLFYCSNVNTLYYYV